MQDHRFFSKENLMRKALPFVYTTSLMAAIVNLYTGSVFNLYVIAAMLITAVVYAMCDFMMKHKLLAAPVYMLASFLAGFAVLAMYISAPSRIMIFEWFMTGGSTVETIPQYMLIIVIGFGFFLSSVTYYFSHVIYRVAIFTLLSLIPCAIYVKAAVNIPLPLVSVIAALNLFLFIADKRRTHSKEYNTKGNFGFTAYVDFAAAAVLIAVLLPKPSVAPYYEKFEEFSNRFVFWGRANTLSGEYMEHSGNADAYQEIENKLIFNVHTDTPQYFKMQVFDSYDEENNWWTVSDRQSRKHYSDWEQQASQQSLFYLYNAYVQSGSPIIEKQKYQVITEKDKIKSAVVQAVNYPSQFVISPVRTVNALINDRPDEKIMRSAGYELFPPAVALRSNEKTTLNYYNENFANNSGWIESGLCDVSYMEYYVYLDEIQKYYKENVENYENNQLYKAVCAYSSEAFEALSFDPTAYPPVSDELQKISDEITDGLIYDYEKAQAIMDYFAYGGFRYDLAYKAPEGYDTPEYFLTESRRGTCSDYATAFCLLARAAGLSVRYVEGFSGDPSETTAGLYEIYTEDAHAYPEVFISGAGWLIYDPTPADNSLAAGDGAEEAAKEEGFIVILITCVALFVSLSLVILLIVLMPSIERRFFSLKVRKSSSERAIVLIYGRLAATADRLCSAESDVMTSAQLSRFIEEYTGISPDEIIKPFERVCYGGLSAEREEILRADMLLKEITAAIKAVNKEKRSSKH